jgi:hydroxymethylbilane synthase
MSGELRIGARRSPLARIQAQLAGAALLAQDPGLRIRYVFLEASGDRSAEPSAALVTARGGFTEDLGRLLDAGAIDLAVHSWKDLPLPARAATDVFASLPRADARDVLLIRRDRLDACARAGAGAGARGLTILSSSARRRLHLERFLGWALPLRDVPVRFAPVRGDIGTRLRKLLRGDGDALVIAKAAIDRLLDADPDLLGAAGVPEATQLVDAQRTVREALEACRVLVLPLQACPAAPAQGALALEARRDSRWLPLLGAVNDHDTFETVGAERALAGEVGEDEPLGVTRLRLDWGDVEFARGVRGGEPFEHQAVHRRGPGLPPPTRAEALWSGDLDDARELERLALPEAPRSFHDGHGLLVARAEALPPGSAVGSHTPLWTAGLETWRRLAAAGHWVVGSDESLGETGARAIRGWFPRAGEWLKLSHEQGHDAGVAGFVPTYRLRRSRPRPVDGRSHFFWRSGSQLRDYLAAFPGLERAWHGCGPGNTLAIARGLLDPQRLRPFLSGAQFRAELLP